MPPTEGTSSSAAMAPGEVDTTDAAETADHFESAEEEEADFASAEEEDAPAAEESRAAPGRFDVDEPAAAGTMAAELSGRLEGRDDGGGFMACLSCESGGLDKPPR